MQTIILTTLISIYAVSFILCWILKWFMTAEEQPTNLKEDRAINQPVVAQSPQKEEDTEQKNVYPREPTHNSRFDDYVKLSEGLHLLYSLKKHPDWPSDRNPIPKTDDALHRLFGDTIPKDLLNIEKIAIYMLGVQQNDLVVIKRVYQHVCNVRRFLKKMRVEMKEHHMEPYRIFFSDEVWKKPSHKSPYAQFFKTPLRMPLKPFLPSWGTVKLKKQVIHFYVGLGNYTKTKDNYGAKGANTPVTDYSMYDLMTSFQHEASYLRILLNEEHCTAEEWKKSMQPFYEYVMEMVKQMIDYSHLTHALQGFLEKMDEFKGVLIQAEQFNIQEYRDILDKLCRIGETKTHPVEPHILKAIKCCQALTEVIEETHKFNETYADGVKKYEKMICVQHLLCV